MTVESLPSGNAFVGRSRELAELRTGLDDAVAGRGKLFLVAGEPGIGKTRLAEEVSREAMARGIGVAWGRCWEGKGAPSYWPLIQVIRACCGDLDGQRLAQIIGSRAPEIIQLLPELVPKLGQSLPPHESKTRPSDPEAARFQLFDSVATLLKDLTRSKPLMIVIDDLHDADQPSLQMLRFIARAAKDAALVILGTYRDAEVKQSPELGKLVGDLIREGHLFPLTGLSKLEVSDFIERRTGRSAADKLVADLYRATDGNALYVEGIVRLLESDVKVEHAANDRDSFRIPDGVRGSIKRQLDALSDKVHSLLAIASVVGTEFDGRVLERVSGDSAELIVDRLEEAARIGIVTSPLPGYVRYRFSHGLIREVLYEELSVKHRIKLHDQIGTAMEEIHPGDLKHHWAQLAHHFTQARVGEKAIDCWIKAGEAAYSVFGFEEAASCWRAALALTEQYRTDPLVRARVQERLGDPTIAREAGAPEIVAHLEAALRAYQDLGDVQREARVHVRLGHLMSTNIDAMDIPAALVHFRKAEATINQVPESPLLGFLYSGFGSAAREAMQTKEGLRTSRRAMQIAERLGAEALWIDAAALHSDQLLNAGQIKEAFSLIEETYVKADILNQAGAACTAALIYGVHYIHLLDPDQAESCLLRELGKPRLDHAPPLRDILLARLEAAQLLKGELRASKRSRIEGRTDWFAEGRQRIFSGEWEMGGAAIARSLKYCRRIGSCDAAAQLLVYAAKICRLRGQYEEGVTQLREGLSLCGDDLNSLCEMEARPELILLLVQLKSPEEVQFHLARCREITAAGENWRGLAGTLARAEAVVAVAEGRYQDAEKQYQKAIEVFRRYHVPFEEAETFYYWGRALNESGEQSRANEKLDAAIEIYRRCGAGGQWIERAETARVSGTEALTHQPAVAPSDAVFRREADYWTIAYEGRVNRLKDIKGMSYIARLLGHPDEEVHSLDLVGGGETSENQDPRAETQAAQAEFAQGLGDAGEMLDAAAKASYLQSLKDLRAELGEAERSNDFGRAEKIREEIDFIEAELARAIGLHGRDRRAASAAERARLSVTRAIKAALARIGEEDATLGRLLGTTIRTGNFCSYRPDARFRINWQL